ncbi:MAG: carbohydrate kinase family protein [Planctomycetota bacterium]|nr:MAG: carbohydrate kinase family protein [Planctomycetota bacterium]
MTASIAVTGSIAWDHIMNFPGRFKDHILSDKLHILNVSFLVGDFRRQRGGCAANIAYALALHGLRPRLVGAAGCDFAPYREWLEEQGVDCEGVCQHDDVATASCFITTDADNNQITCFYPGAMARAAEAPLSGDHALATVSPNDPEAMRAYPRRCRELGLPFLYDPGQQVIALSGEDLVDGLTGAKVVVCNDYELAVVQEKTGRDVAGLLELAEAVVVTLGKEGSRAHLRDGTCVEVPAAPVREVVDPTGCGDAYRGGLVKGIVEGEDWETALRWGTLTAAYCVEVRGTTGYEFTVDRFAERLGGAFASAS